MSAPHPLADSPRSQAGTPTGVMETALDTPAATRRGKANCGFCGKARFGDVAYCPYCGRPSASAPAGKDVHAPPAADRDAAARADAPAPAPQATLPPAQKPQPGYAASAPAADGRAMQALANSIHSYAGRMLRFRAPSGARAGQQGMRWMARWMGIIGSAMALALVGIAVQDVAERNSARRVPAAGAASTPPSEASARVAAPRAAPAPATAPATAAMTAPAPNGNASAPSAQVLGAGPAMPRAADTAPPQQPPAAALPARNRTLCSAANEAAGLCNPQ